MIISASRRTDIPSFYSDWLYNRITDRFVIARNPRNFRQVSKVSLAPGDVDGIVFWTKNPAPMLERLGELRDYTFYFQFTLTPYGREIEPNLPAKESDLLETFKKLSDRIGPDRVVWRYDPVLINARYSPEYHIDAFGRFAEALYGFTHRVTISFIDEDYRGVRNNIKGLALLDFPLEMQTGLGAGLAKIARSRGMAIGVCAEKMDLQAFGIDRARCIDAGLIEKLSGRFLNIGKDKNQRPECGCAASTDIGMYNTCQNGCLYCYANYNPKLIARNASNHNPLSPLIYGEPE